MIGWEWLDRPGLEVLDLAVTADAVIAVGHVVAALGSDLMRLRYKVLCDAAWRFRSAHVAVARAGVSRSVQVARSAAGEWCVDGVVRPDLAECEDVDIMATPFTNTLPIRRVTPGDRLILRAAHVRVPHFEVVAVAQEYLPLGPGRLSYRNLESGFAADVAVDPDGLVLRYGAIWRRLGRAGKDLACA